MTLAHHHPLLRVIVRCRLNSLLFSVEHVANEGVEENHEEE